MNPYTETLYDAYGQTFRVDKIHYENKTEHQHLVIFQNARFGRVMALDGVIQTTEADEFIYHEMLTHVPLFAHGAAKKVLIIGGGDGGILREVCKHPEVESVVQVEIDAAVVEMSKQYLPHHSAGAFEDARAEIIIDDGAAFVKNTDRKFDVIISDSTDPIGPAEVLFSEDFYAHCKSCLNPGGIMVTQNGVAFMQLDEVTNTAQRLGPCFPHATFYSAAVPTYIGGVMTFGWASEHPDAQTVPLAVLQDRFEQSGIETRYYHPAIHQASFVLPKYIVDAIASVRS